MLRKAYFFLVFTFVSVVSAYGQVGEGSLKGTIKDSQSGETLPFVNVVIEANGVQKGGGATDIDGKFFIKPISPGTYDVKVSSVGYRPKKITGVVVKGSIITFLDIDVQSSEIKLEEFEVVEYSVPLIDKDGGASGGTITRDDIAKMPGRSASSIAATVGGVGTNADGAITSVRGSRGDATFYYIDGIKVRGSTNLPKSAIQEVSVLTGGLPANYGDATGGIISITTRGASSKYFGGIEYLTSGWKTGDTKVIGLDNYGYNLIEGNISGPILRKKDAEGNRTEPLIGFFSAITYRSILDPRPSAVPIYKVKDDVKEDLIAEPLRPSGLGQGVFYNTDFLDEDSFEEIKYRRNANSKNVFGQTKIDINTTPSVTLTFGGSLDWNQNHIYNYNGSLFNWNNNGLSTGLAWRAYGKFTQRFLPPEGEEQKSSIKNAYYTVMVDYSKNQGKLENEQHGDNLFGYGYLGKFTTYRTPTYGYNSDLNAFVHNGFRDTLITFAPSDVNPDAAAITTQYYDIYDDPVGNYQTFTEIQQGNALRNGDAPASVYNLWTNIGTTYGTYQESDATQFRITTAGSADIGDHAVSLGFEYEQRSDRVFSVGPRGLWNHMRQLTNFHIRELDTTQATVDYVGTFPYITYERLIGNDQFTFDRNLRDKIGAGATDFIDVDALDPSTFSLDMFSADELLNDGNSFVFYYGYDHTGQKLDNKPSFDDFFTAQDENGDFTRPIGAFEPIYVAGYVMDKFAFDDIIFNVGVRVDRFDANQPVLKDPYLLYEAYTAGETASGPLALGAHPENIGDDYVVYVNDINNPTGIVGYRDGDRWFNADGEEINDPTTLRTASGIAPYLVDPDQEEISSSAFKDYDPQVIVMPRISFSFPISDEALFFAHYDVLSKRPTTGNRLNPLDYFYIENRNVTVNNPDLKPEKTIDYELGFQQVLSKSSSIKISAFYRELRDMVQLVNFQEAYPSTYVSYSNIDFGTVKGTTISFDLRRTGNIWMRAAYTLQFAEGTGSAASSASTLVNTGQPNLRTINPFDYDQRHAIVATVDYRYGDGKDYNGPVWFGKQVFSNTGLNFTSNLGSGTPYSAQSNITADAAGGGGGRTLEGQINGSRKPGTFRIDAQLDKNITLKFGGSEDSKKTANLNVYLQVNNLLNTQNILNVYRATGNADDDGYLNAAEHQASIEQQNNEAAFRYYYGLKLNNPGNFSLPRTIRLGVRLDF